MSAAEVDRLLAATASFLRCRERKELVARVTDSFRETMGFAAACLRLRDPLTGTLEVWMTSGSRGQISLGGDLDPSELETILAEENRNGSCYLVSGENSPSGSFQLYFPFLGSDQSILGMIQLADFEHGGLPEAERLRLGERLAEQAALALESMNRNEELSKSVRELSSSQRRVEELEAQQEEFLDGISHELRTPLTSIQAYCEGLLAQHGTMDEQLMSEFLQIILEESQRLHERVEDLLAVARREHPADSKRREKFDFSQLIREAVGRLGTLFREKSLRCQAVLPNASVVYEGNRPALDQVVLELLENAIKFTPEGGLVTISLGEAEGAILLQVEDTGDGVPEGETGRVFERFYQVDGSRTRSHGGQGLGLSVCQQIVDDHDGRIWVEKGESGGARFCVRIPRRRAVLRNAFTRRTHRDIRDELSGLLDASVALVAELMGCGIASIMVYDEREDCLRIQAAVGLDEEVVRDTRVEPGKGVAGRVYESGQAILLEDLRSDSKLAGAVNEDQYQGYGVLSVPIFDQQRVVGVLNVNNQSESRAFDEDDRLLLEALALRIERAWSSYENFERSHDRMAQAREAFRATVNLSRHRRTALRELIVHCGLQAMRAAGTDESEIRSLSYALRIYDLGLSTVGEDILSKATPLSVADQTLIRDHSRRGARLARGLEDDGVVESMLYHHHENWDGSGYPEAIQGEAIPRGARIIRLVDAFSAMLHGRPGRPPLDLDEATALLQEGLGRRFCPQLGPHFLQAVAKHERRFRESLQLRIHPVAETEREIERPLLVGEIDGGVEEDAK